MKSQQSHQITQLLLDWSGGNKAALDELMPIVFDDLRRLAQHYMRGQKAGHTLQTTALVNEAYLRLVDSDQVRWQDRTHFFAIAAQLMRHVLVDSARARNSRKRGGEHLKITLDERIEASSENDLDFVELDEALNDLAKLSERQSKVVELRYFGGLKENEIAETLNISVRTVRRDWNAARAWLFRRMRDEG